MQSRHLTVPIVLSALLVSCSGGGGDEPNEGGLVGFSTGTPQTGPVPSDGTSPAAPTVTGVVVTNNLAKNGDAIHVNVSFVDPQGDILTVNAGIAGQPSHSTIAVTGIGMQTNGTLFIDLKPSSNSPGNYTLVVSITDAAGNTSVAVSVPFTILNPDGSLPGMRVDGGGSTKPIDAAQSPDMAGPALDAGAPDLSIAAPEVGKEVGTPDSGRDVAVQPDLGPADLPPVGDVACGNSGGVIASTSTGGLWHDATTWICGVVPTASNDVQINGEVHVNLSAAQAVANCRNLSVAASGVLRGAPHIDAKLNVMGDLVNAGAVRNGPSYASTDGATLVIYLAGNFTQNNIYAVTTHFTGAATQTITYGAGIKMAGSFIDDNPASSLKAGSALAAEATTFTLGASGAGGGTLDMGSFALTLASGDFKIAFGTLQASTISGVEGATLSAEQIAASAGTLTLAGDVRTGSATITGGVIVATGAAFYNKSNVDAVVTITGGLTNNGIVRAGPGYAAYGAASMTLNLGGDFAQNGDYTASATNLNGTTAQTITLLAGKTLTGKFSDTTGASPLQAGSDLNITEAEIVLATGGALKMGSYQIVHPSGTLQIATGTLEVNDLTGDDKGSAPFLVADITPPSGTLTVHNHFRTGSVNITGNLVLAAAARMYNKSDVQAKVTVTGTVTSDATALMGSGPGYASYDSGALFLNGTKLAAW